MQISLKHPKHYHKTSLRPYLYIAVLPLAIVYYECVFNLFTSKHLFTWDALLMMQFSIAYGLLACLLISVVKRPKANRIVTAVLMALLTIPYFVEYFVYCGFKVFYDFTTITSGAKDVATGYTKEAMQVVFSWNGLLFFLLLTLPFALFLIF